MTYQMQEWDAEADCTCEVHAAGREHPQPGCPYPGVGYRWVPMEDGPAKSVWRPRRTPQEAATKALTWTGLVGIPAMQVVNLETGEVVWRDSRVYPDAGPSIEPEWGPGVRRAVAASLREARAEELAEWPAQVSGDDAGPAQAGLFDLGTEVG